MDNTTSREWSSFGSDQEAINWVFERLVEQGGPSMSQMGMHNESFCAYRGEGGRRCAAGWVIPDERYSPNLEGAPANSLALTEAIGQGAPHFLIHRLQRVHDTASRDAVNWKDALAFCWQDTMGEDFDMPPVLK